MALPKKEIWACDCETDPFDGKTLVRPFIWGAFCLQSREYHQFNTTREFLDFITARDCIAYAHNGGKFDWLFFTDELPEFSRVMLISGRLAKFRIGECEFRDSFSLLPVGLGKIEKEEIDYNIMKKSLRDIPKNRRRIEDYLKSDCVNLANILEAYFDEFGFHLTLAGASMKAWEKITNQKAPQTNADFFNSIAPYYYGGRVECFERGEIKRDFKVYDVNSMYPFAMLHNHPWGESITISDVLPKSEKAVQQAFITLTAKSLGAFPWREKRGEKLTFPADGQIREFRISGWEFLAARDTGHLKNWDVLEVATLPLTQNFKPYLDHFYQMKVEAKRNKDRARYEFAKRFQNSLYGKFGANPENYDEYTVMGPQWIEAAQEEDGYAFCAELGPWALMSRPIPSAQHRYYNVATAASITGFARAYLWRSMQRCTGVLYCDTDSIVCTDGSALDCDPERLGAWDIEAECDYGAIAGKKLYAFHKKGGGWKKASKGVKFSRASIIRVARGKKVTHNPLAPSFSLKRGIRFTPRSITMRN